MPWKKWKPETTRVTARPSLPLFSIHKSSQKLFSKLAALKFRKIPLGNPRWITVLVAGHRPLYLLNCVDIVSGILKQLFLEISPIDWYNQKQPTEVFYKKAALKNFATFTGKHLCWSPQARNVIKKRLQHRCFPVNITTILRTPILKTSANGCFV